MAFDLTAPFRRKREKKLFFALVVADRPTDGFKFIPDKDCEMFMVTGETVPRLVIPGTVLQEIVERFQKQKPVDGKIIVSEKSNAAGN